MFRKIVFGVLSLFFWIPVLAQDDVRNVEVSVNDPQPRVLDYDFCNLLITANEYDDSSITMHINVENSNETYSIFLFGHAYTEKVLKSQKIYFDKKSYGTTSKEILVCDGLSGDGIMRIEPNGNRVLTFPNISETKIKVELPIYIAKNKKKKFLDSEKYMIRQRVKLIINVTFDVPQEADNQYDDIKRRCDDLIARIDATPICISKKHPINESAQIAIIRTEIDNLKDDIADIKSDNHWRERDEAYKPYKELLASLDDIKFNKSVCEKCSRNVKPVIGSKHDCKFCSKSPSEILLFLQRTYQELDNRKIRKSDALKKIDGAHKAWIRDCKILKKKMDADSSTKYKVEKYYDAIVNY